MPRDQNFILGFTVISTRAYNILNTEYEPRQNMIILLEGGGVERSALMGGGERYILSFVGNL